MTKDRLAELRAAQNNYGQDDTAVTVEMDIMDDFFVQVQGIRKMINDIETSLGEVKRRHGIILSSPFTNEKVQQELDDHMADIKKTGSNIHFKLKVIEQNVKEHASNSSANVRIQKTELGTLSQKFTQVMTEYNEMQVSFRERCKQRLKRQLAITGRTTTDEEIEDLLEGGNQQVFTHGILVETEQAKLAMDMYTDMMKLENSIQELHELFLNVSVLVAHQGETVTSIEGHVQQALDYVEPGVQHLGTAQKLQSKARRKKLAIVLCIVVVVAILIGVLVLSLK